MAHRQTNLINSAEPVDWYDTEGIDHPGSWDAVKDCFWGFTHYWESTEHFGILLNMYLSQTTLTDKITTLAFVFHKGYSNP